jgi:hypothetical protein
MVEELNHILQNIATRNPRLSGHLRSQPFDQAFSVDPDRPFYPRFSTRPGTTLAALADLRACIVRGPLVCETWNVAVLVFATRRRETRWLCRYFGSVFEGKIVFSHVIFWRATVERTTVATRPSPPGTGHAGHGRTPRWLWRGAWLALAATHSRALFSPFLFIPSPNPSRRPSLVSQSGSRASYLERP